MGWMAVAVPWIILVAILIPGRAVVGQQEYYEADQFGYRCDSATPSCSAFAAYRALQGDTLRTVGARFGLSAEQVSEASQIPASGAALTTNQLLLIPITNCSCASGRSQYNVSYIIQKGDTFYDVSQKTFQGLTTYQAVERANPAAVPTQLQPGDSVIFPVRCACPSSQQRAAGVQVLVTYPFVTGDSIEGLAAGWKISSQTIQSGNVYSGAPVEDKNLQAITTLLLPVTESTPALPLESTNPTPPAQPPVSPPSDDGSSGSSAGKYIGIGVGAAAAVALVALAGFCFYSRRRQANKKNDLLASKHQSLTSISTDQGAHGSINSSEYGNTRQMQQQKNQNEFLLLGMNDLVDSEKPVVFTYEELKQATNNFSKSYLIQGSVYRGMVRKQQLVAIKEMKGGASSQELKILCKVHHTNLVRLVGVCSAGDQLFLVYDYAENGSLSACLHNKQQPVEVSDVSSVASSASSLTWNARLQIALDVATGLEYIHDYTKPSFVHKDVKSSNILLDSHLRAKIANFGMARLADDAVLTKHIAGTQGYMSPEYLNHGFVSTKLDVYSFGIVLFELLTGKEAIMSEGAGNSKQYLADAMIQLVDEMKHADDKEVKIETLKAWLDPILENAVPWDGLLSFVELAGACVNADPDSRPNMKDVTYKLSKLLDSSLEWETASALNKRYNSAQLEGR